MGCHQGGAAVLDVCPGLASPDAGDHRAREPESSMKRRLSLAERDTPADLLDEFAAQHIRAHVMSLLVNRGPSTVPRFIVSIVIWKSIDRIRRRWSLSHVGKKCFKVSSPPIANGDAAPAVVFPCTVIL